jgi:hypothetical protein
MLYAEGSTFGPDSVYTGVLKGYHSMNQDRPQPQSQLFSQIDVSQAGQTAKSSADEDERGEQTRLLDAILCSQDRQNELLEELVSQLGTTQKQRASELGQWKQANPYLARNCRKAAESLGKVQTEFLDALTQEINENFEAFLDGEFMLNEFVDRFGPRMAHLNGLLQVLSQLSASVDPANTPHSP